MTDTKDKAMTPITMQDVRLIAGEGKLSAHDVLAAVNAHLRLHPTPPAPQVEGEIEAATKAIDTLICRHREANEWYSPRQLAECAIEAVAALRSVQVPAPWNRCATCNDDPVECAKIPLRHCEKLQRDSEAPARTYADGIEDGWQPIETAPINKTVLVCNPDEGEIPVLAKRYSTGWINVGAIPVGNNSGRDFKLEPAPLYWMPLPSPPRALANKASG